MARPSATRWVAAGEAADARAEQMLDAQDGGHLLDAAVDLGARHAFVAQRELEVVSNAHVRVEREELEHHRDVPLARPQVGDIVAVERDLPGGRVLEPRDHAQRGRLAAARGPEQHDELAVFEHQRGVVHRGEVGEALLQVLDSDFSHGVQP